MTDTNEEPLIINGLEYTIRPTPALNYSIACPGTLIWEIVTLEEESNNKENEYEQQRKTSTETNH